MLGDAIKYIVSVDLGFRPDPTALCVLQLAENAPIAKPNGDPIYEIPHLERHVAREYPDTIEDVSRLMHSAEFYGQAVLVLDGTGVGVPVTQAFRRHTRMSEACRTWLTILPIMITGTGTVTKKDGFLHVPKPLLVSTVQSVLHTGRLRIAPALALATVLREELRNFRAKFSETTAHVSFNAREGTHDDLVLAAAQALFIAETFRNTDFRLIRASYE